MEGLVYFPFLQGSGKGNGHEGREALSASSLSPSPDAFSFVKRRDCLWRGRKAYLARDKNDQALAGAFLPRTTYEF
jgi:hypothetical protein